MGEALLIYADNLEAFVQVLVNEGETDITTTVDDVISYQQRLATSGFTAQDIGDYRQGVIAANPNDISGNVLTFYTGEVTVSRQLAQVLLYPWIFASGLHVSGGAELKVPCRHTARTAI